MKKKDLISVVIPVYNCEKTLEKCLKSIINQSYDNIEILVINDGSPDNSQKIVEKYIKKYPEKVKSFIKKNGGVSDTRNYGLSKAKGKYIIFIDSDDYIDKNMIKIMYDRLIDSNSDIAICDVFDEYENSNKKEIYRNKYKNEVTNIFEEKEILFNRAAVWNKLIKMELFKKNKFKFLKGKICEDLCLISQMFLSADKIVYVSKPLHHYIIQENSLSKSRNISKKYDIIDALTEIINYYKEKNKYDEFKDQIEYLAIEHLLIGALCSVIKLSNFKDIKKNIKVLLDFMEENFSDYNNNKYIKNISKKRKLILFLLKTKQYFILKILLNIKK